MFRDRVQKLQVFLTYMTMKTFFVWVKNGEHPPPPGPGDVQPLQRGGEGDGDPDGARWPCPAGAGDRGLPRPGQRPLRGRWPPGSGEA